MSTLDDAREGMNPDIRPQDDLFGHVNGRWLDEVEIPADRSSWGPFVQLADVAEAQVRDIIDLIQRYGSSVPLSVEVFTTDPDDMLRQAQRFISEFGSAGRGNGQFDRPYGIAIDKDGYVYVSDLGNKRIQKFAPGRMLNDPTSVNNVYYPTK